MIRKMHTNRIAPMIERGYREGTKFQWVRETAINAIEAGATRIEFGVEWQAVNARGVYRRMIADNGKGMTPEELQEVFNCFGGGGKAIGDEHENFGIGAKTALLPWNHHGVVVISWVEGQAAMIRIMREEKSGEYGLEIFPVEDDQGQESYEAVVTPYNDPERSVDWSKVKPSWIDQHGTVIVLLGNHAADDTFRGDLARDEDGTKDISQYLNHRLWDLRDRVQISAVEFLTTNKANWPKSEPLSKSGETGVIVRAVRGTKHYIANQTLFAARRWRAARSNFRATPRSTGTCGAATHRAIIQPRAAVPSACITVASCITIKITIIPTGCSGSRSRVFAAICGWSCGHPSSTSKPRSVSTRAPRATRCNGLGAVSYRCQIGANNSPTSCQRPSSTRCARPAAKGADQSTITLGKNSSRSVSARSGSCRAIGRIRRARNKPIARPLPNSIQLLAVGTHCPRLLRRRDRHARSSPRTNRSSRRLVRTQTLERP
jgi:hypothetical protein